MWVSEWEGGRTREKAWLHMFFRYACCCAALLLQCHFRFVETNWQWNLTKAQRRSHSLAHTHTHTAQESATLATFVTTRRDAVEYWKTFRIGTVAAAAVDADWAPHGGVFRVVCWKKVQSPQKRRRSCLRCLLLLLVGVGCGLCSACLVGLPLLLLDVGCDSCWNNNNESVLRACLICFLFTLTPSQQQFMHVYVCVFSTAVAASTVSAAAAFVVVFFALGANLCTDFLPAFSDCVVEIMTTIISY